MEAQVAGRRGRRRSGGERYASGRLKQPHERDTTRDVVLAQRAAEGVRQGLLDQRWGSKLGQMVLRSEITETMMQAGERWAEMTRQYQRLFPGLPRATTALLERAIGRKLEIDPDDERAVRRAVSIERAYVRAAAAISTLHRAPAVFRSLMRLCVLDELLGDFQARLDAISGLRVLELHFCLTRE